MYLDYILFAAGGILLFTAILLAVFLVYSRKRSKDYRRILDEGTQQISVIDTLRKTTQSTQSDSSSIGSDLEKTQMIETQFLSEQTVDGNCMDWSALQGKYTLLREISGGGMSRVFLAQHTALGNEWIVKYVDMKNAELANEAEVLKQLNHISLPQIIDVFQTEQGVFLVERYIEGYSLAEVLTLGEEIRESLICDWGLQLAQVLNYLHNLDTPIIHCDLKPSNIMVTHDNRLVLIDFGISKRQGIDDVALGITYKYAAPEQFQNRRKSREIVQKRFGRLPPEQEQWQIDPRTDIYSVGVILYELVMGDIPYADTLQNIYDHTAPKLANIICKCLELDPNQRFQSAQELAAELENMKSYHLSMARSLVVRKVALVCCGVCLVGGLITSASAAYVNQMERLAVVSMDPGSVVVTEQQTVQLLIQKTLPNGEVIVLEPSQIQWSYSDENIARVDADRLVGLNIGETTLYGQYRNHMITLHVTVSERIDELVEIALRYQEDVEVSIYAGNGERDFVDGSLKDCSFVSPESMSADGDTLYLSDSGIIRTLTHNMVSTLPLEPDYLTADLVRSWKGELYILTGPWEDENDSYYGFLRISGNHAEFLYYTQAIWSVITDFAFSSDGTLWFIEQNLGTGTTNLNTLNPDTQETAWIMDLPDNTRNMAFDEHDTLYLSVPDSGVILRIGAGKSAWTYFAGVEGERNFIDGAIPNFYRPTSLVAQGNALYVLDFDTVRKITIAGEGAIMTETIAGVPTEDTNPEIILGKGEETVLPASERATLWRNDAGQILLSDPKNSIIYELK